NAPRAGSCLQTRRTPPSRAPWACPPRGGRQVPAIGRAPYLIQTPILQTNRAEFPAPDATRIEGEEVGRNAQAERRPVTTYQGVISAFPAGHLEPRKVAGGSFGRFAFAMELHYTFRSAKAQAGHCVDDDAQPVDSAQVVVPAIRARTVKLREKFPVPGSTQFRLDFSARCFRCGDVPLRQEPRVDGRVVCGDVHQRPVPQPVEPAVAIRRGETVTTRVVLSSFHW